MAIGALIYGIGGAIAGGLFGFSNGIGGAIIAAIIGGFLGYMMGSIPGFASVTSLGVGIPGFVLVLGVAGLAGATVVNLLF